jgi:hypothetical protein
MPMKRKTLILLCLSLCFLTADARPRKARTPARAKTVTVTGCVTQGVECPLLVSFDGNRKYSLSHDRRLKAGRAYRITGTIQEMSTCMQGPHLSPRRVTPLRTRCRM